MIAAGFHRPLAMSHRLLRSTAITGGMTLLSRIAGMVRDIVFAGLIGAGAGVAADAFYVAFRIPNFFRRIFGEGAFSQAFVPVLSEYRTTRTEEETRAFASHMTAAFATILAIVTAAGMLAAPLIIMALAPGFVDEPEKFQLTVDMLRITFPYLFFISLVAMAAGLLNAYGRFAAAAFTPVLLNLCLIAAALWLAPRLDVPVMALAWGVFFAGLIQLLFQFPFLARLRMLRWPRLRRDEGVGRVFRLMVPAIFGSSVSQINMLVNTILASFLVTGSVSWLYYSDRLMEFPLGVFGIALATVILPSLSREHAAKSPETFSRMMDWALRWVLIIGIPATVGLALLAEPIIATLFRYGAFTDNDVVMSAQALVVFALGLPALILVKVLAPGFYARHDTATPARIAAVAFGANIGLSLLLVFPLKHVGLALAITLAAYLNAGMLYRRLRREQVYAPRQGWLALIVKVGLAVAAMGLLLCCVRGELPMWLALGPSQRVLQLSIWIVTGFLVYVVILRVAGIRLTDLRMKE
jgi:putative peptidoglycan lipid II flippase